MDKIMGLYISPDLIFSITFVSVMNFHNHLCMSISTKILKKKFCRFGTFDQYEVFKINILKTEGDRVRERAFLSFLAHS